MGTRHRTRIARPRELGGRKQLYTGEAVGTGSPEKWIIPNVAPGSLCHVSLKYPVRRDCVSRKEQSPQSRVEDRCRFRGDGCAGIGFLRREMQRLDLGVIFLLCKQAVVERALQRLSLFLVGRGT